MVMIFSVNMVGRLVVGQWQLATVVMAEEGNGGGDGGGTMGGMRTGYWKKDNCID